MSDNNKFFTDIHEITDNTIEGILIIEDGFIITPPINRANFIS